MQGAIYALHVQYRAGALPECSTLLKCSVSARMSEQSERKRTRGTSTGSTPRQVEKRSMSPTSGVTLKSKHGAAPSAYAGVPLMLLSEKDTFFLLFSVPLVCFLSNCSLILALTEHLVYCTLVVRPLCTVRKCRRISLKGHNQQ